MNQPLSVGIPIIGGKNWTGGVYYVEHLVKAVSLVPSHNKPRLYLVVVDKNMPDLDCYEQLFTLLDGLIFVGCNKTNLPIHTIQISSLEEIFKIIDVYYPVLAHVWREMPAISWIPDFQHVHLPEMFSAEALQDRYISHKAIADNAKMVVFSSHDARNDFINLFPTPKASTRVLQFCTLPDDSWYRDNYLEIQKLYNLPDNFFICCNQFWAHKNHICVFEALSHLHKKGIDVHLVCTGGTVDHRFPEYFTNILSYIKELELVSTVHILGLIPREHQIQLIRRSLAVIQPSLFEGWSTVVEDCRALGKVMLLSDLNVHKEQAPHDALYFKRTAPTDLVRIILDVLPELSAGPDVVLEKKALAQVRQRTIDFGNQFCTIVSEAKELFVENSITPALSKSYEQKNSSIVKQFWSVNDCSASERNFYCFPAIRERSARLIFGDVDASDRDWCEFWTVEKYLKGSIPVDKALSICCGFGAIERTLTRLNVARNIIGIDIAPGAIEQARQRAQQEGLHNIEYYVSDINHDELPSGQFDLVWANGALHHIRELDRVVPMLYNAMKDGAFLISNEYVGPKYQQVGPKQQYYINQLRTMLPSELKLSDDIWQPHSIEYFLNTDPSECVNSDLIIPTLQDCFEHVEVRHFGGSILFYALDQAFYENFNPHNKGHVDLLEYIFKFEDSLISRGEITSDNAHIICRKLPPTSKQRNATAVAQSPRATMSRTEASYIVDVSIVVATKNRAALLEKMLVSLEEAARGISCEIIAIDGDSTDNTLQVLRKHGATVFAESTAMGPGRHSWPQLYNFGFSKARGKWAMYASDDIVFSPGCLNKAIEQLEAADDTVAGGIFYYRNVDAEPGWEKYGIDYTLGQKLLMNYGLVRTDRFREAGGLDEAYRFYCADGDLCLKLYQRGYQFIPLVGCSVLHDNALDSMKQLNLEMAHNDIEVYKQRWGRLFPEHFGTAKRLFLCTDSVPEQHGGVLNKYPKLHLGCGEHYLEGYVNIDYPPSEHSVQARSVADIHADLTQLHYPASSVAEVRLHHVFEHFRRPVALALLASWHYWLVPAGCLRIEVPDFERSAGAMIGKESTFHAMAVAQRHLFGSHEAHWAAHYEGYTTLALATIVQTMGFTIENIEQTEWRETFNFELYARKTGKEQTVEQYCATADSILRAFLVDESASEMRLHEVWMSAFREQLLKGCGR